MNLSQNRYLIIFLLIFPYILVTGVILNTGIGDWTYFAIRFCGLLGFLSLSLGAIVNLVKNELKSILGYPFIKIHHVFVITGLILITIHPVILASDVGNFSVFFPDTSSITAFLINGGRIAIILIYIGFLASVFRSILKGRWIYIHRIMYLALAMGIIHANLLGEDFIDPIIRILYNGIAGGVFLIGIIKMRYRHKIKILKDYVKRNT